MMINKRLIGMLDKSKKYVALNVVFQWISLAANIVMMFAVTRLLGLLFSGGFTSGDIIAAACVSAAALTVRFICTLLSSKMSFLSSKSVKKTLRTKIYEKLLSLGPSYNERVQTSEVVQVAVEGVDQLDTYFGAYLPQFFLRYACACNAFYRSLLCKHTVRRGFAYLRADDTCCDSRGADLGKKTSFKILDSIYSPRRYFS